MIHSIRFRFLIPVIAAAVVASVLVAIGSLATGRRWAMADVRTRFAGIDKTLRRTTFPLTAPVLQSLADLTATQMLTLDGTGRVTSSTFFLSPEQRNALSRHFSVSSSQADVAMPGQSGHSIDSLGQRYLAFEVTRSGLNATIDRVDRVITLFNRDQIDAAGRRWAILPLATGFSTILLLTAVSIGSLRRWSGRLIRLQQRVDQVARGDFQSRVADHSTDEIGRLGEAVDSMAGQLEHLWQTVHRQQGEQLLHQFAGGLAHQLRNTLTGARLAIELHASGCRGDAEGVCIAIGQIEKAEDHVRRLLLVAAGHPESPQPMNARQCIHDLRPGLDTLASHLGVIMRWEIDDSIDQQSLRDGPGWIASVHNLVHNAIQAGPRVRVSIDAPDHNTVRVIVRDDGPGVPHEIATDLWEPFVSKRPEGMGLGLAVVARTARSQDGSVRWQRHDDTTEFEFSVKTQSP